MSVYGSGRTNWEQPEAKPEKTPEENAAEIQAAGEAMVAVGCIVVVVGIVLLVVFGGLSYSYQLGRSDLNHRLRGGRTLTGVSASDGIGINMGLGYALSYKVTVNAILAASYSFGTTFEYLDGGEKSTGTALSSSLSLGTGWRITPHRTVSVGFGMGLTSGNNFSFSFRIPFDYKI